MVRFDVRPELTLHGNNDASARVNVRFNHGPNIIDVGVTDKCVRNGGVSPDGLFIALRNGQGLDFEYDFGRRSPTIRMKSNISIADRLVLVKYSHAMSTNAAHLRLEHQLDANNIAKLDYNTVGYTGLNHRNATVRLSHRQGDFILEPAYNFGTDSVSMAARYDLDNYNRVTARMDIGTSVGSLSWRNRAEDGDLRVTASAVLDKDGLSTRPSLTVSKTWALEK